MRVVLSSQAVADLSHIGHFIARDWKGYGILYSVLTDRIFVHRIIGPGQDHDRALRLR